MSKNASNYYEKLITENMRLVPYVLKRIGMIQSDPDFEDLMQTGYIGLIKAARTFNKDKSKFATYALTCIRNEIFMFFRKENKNIKIISFQDDLPSNNSESDITYEDVIEDKNARFEDRLINYKDIEEMLSLILNNLTVKEKLIILYAISGTMQQNISQEVGITQSYVSRLEKKIREKLRVLMQDSEIYEKDYEVKVTKDIINIKVILSNIDEVVSTFSKIKDEIKSNHFYVRHNAIDIIVQLPTNIDSFYLIAKIVKIVEKF